MKYRRSACGRFGPRRNALAKSVWTMANGAVSEFRIELTRLSPVRVAQEWFDALETLRRANKASAATAGNKR